MKIKIKDLNKLIESYLIIENITSNEEADKFRLWMSKNYPDYKDADGSKLDKIYTGTGSSNNIYVKRAFKKHGKDYERHLKDMADKNSSVIDSVDSDNNDEKVYTKKAKLNDGSTVEFAPTGMSVDILPKSISQITSNDVKNARDIEMLADKVKKEGSVGDNIFLGMGRFLGKSMQGSREVASWLGFDDMSDRLSEDVGTPLHWQALTQFMLQRTSLMTVKSEEAQRAMHYVCQQAQKRHGGKGSNQKIYINYKDYKNGQPEGVNLPTYGNGFSGKMAGEGNPYGQLSLLFGQCIAQELSDGTYEVNDQYDFNADQTQHGKKFEDNIPNYENVSDDLKKVYDGVFGGVKTSSSAALLEPLLVKMEALTGYAGFPVTMKTINPKASNVEAQDKTGIEESLNVSMNISKTKINRRQLRKMILQEMKIVQKIIT